MKIGVLTFNRAYNLGAVLQAFSLQKALEESGGEAELIDYQCPAIDAMHKPYPVFHPGIKPKKRIYNLIYNIVFTKRRLRFKQFQMRLKKSKTYTKQTIGKADGLYDVFITGSDQVFNLRLTGGDTTYFLDFVKSRKKISYAASFGVYLPEKRELYRSLLQSFDYLSLREQSSAEKLREELDLQAQIMPDPVFLHSKDEWIEFLNIRQSRAKKYILIYSLIEKKELYEIARDKSAGKDWKIIAITKVLKPAGKADRYIRNAGPAEFLELLLNAEYVVTNSFHGTAFSLIFEKQFEVVLPGVASERIENLLDGLNLRSQIYDKNNYNKKNNTIIDYEKISPLVSKMKRTGSDYIDLFLDEKHKKDLQETA